MSTLLLARHGQASFGAVDYDVLSERGAVQAQMLGGWLAARRPFDAIYCGPLRRQRDTAQHLVAAGRAAGASWPDPIFVDDFDEMPAFEVVRIGVPLLMAVDEELRGLVARLDQPLASQRVYEIVMQSWLRGELDLGPVESFASFSGRIERAYERVMEEQGRGKRVLVVTSGGTISIAMRRALGLGDRAVVRLHGVILNSSLTELKYRQNEGGALELTLTGFNAAPHLEARPELVTHR